MNLDDLFYFLLTVSALAFGWLAAVYSIDNENKVVNNKHKTLFYILRAIFVSLLIVRIVMMFK